MVQIEASTRPGVDKVKPKRWFKYSLHVLVYMAMHGRPHLVHPALNISILDAGILRKGQQVNLMMFTLNMVDHPMSFLSLSTWDFFK